MSPSAPPFCWIPGYRFTRQDYVVYEQQWAELLASCHARAFLLWGRIAWHLARDSLSLETALNGPSTAVTVFRQGYCFHRGNEQGWWDDSVTDDKLDLLSGLYICHTSKCFILSVGQQTKLINHIEGNGHQTFQKSWWLLTTTWEKKNTLANYGYWTEYNEVWYQSNSRSWWKAVKRLSLWQNHNGRIDSVVTWNKWNQSELVF